MSKNNHSCHRRRLKHCYTLHETVQWVSAYIGKQNEALNNVMLRAIANYDLHRLRRRCRPKHVHSPLSGRTKHLYFGTITPSTTILGQTFPPVRPLLRWQSMLFKPDL